MENNGFAVAVQYEHCFHIILAMKFRSFSRQVKVKKKKKSADVMCFRNRSNHLSTIA